jgi:hypothetical protein
MKYNDKSIELWHKRHLAKDDSKRDRTIRREQKRKLKKFRVRVCQNVDSDWWDSFTFYEQQEIYQSWLNNSVVYWNNKKNDFVTWIKKKYINVKPDKSVFRDKKIDKIINEY